jgi:hypothetical protein
MKLLILALGLMASLAHANMSVDGSRIFPSDIECMENYPSGEAIECDSLQNGYVMCISSFGARLRYGGSDDVKIRIYNEIPRDSTLWDALSFGLTDKLNTSITKSETRLEMKKFVKQVQKFRGCK